MKPVHRGGIFLADLKPGFGTEAGKNRPVLVIQSNFLNREGHSSTIVLPLTSQLLPETNPLRVRIHKNKLTGLDHDSDVLIDQPRSIDNRRFKKDLGGVTAHIMEKVNENLRLIMDLEP